jgi:hypothetical protein
MVKANGPVSFRLIAFPDHPVPDVVAHTVFAWKERRNHENPESGEPASGPRFMIRYEYEAGIVTAGIVTAGIVTTAPRR